MKIAFLPGLERKMTDEEKSNFKYQVHYPVQNMKHDEELMTISVIV